MKELARVRTEYGFRLVGYVVMLNHVLLLMSEPKKGTPSTVLQKLKQRVSRKMRKRSRKTVDGQFEFRLREWNSKRSGRKDFMTSMSTSREK